MTRLPTRLPNLSRFAIASALLATLSACATTVPATGAVLTTGEQASIEGRIASVDTAPWAYDGNAVVMVSTTTHGTVSVQLPARWNLCKAKPPEDLPSFKAGERVQAVGTVTAPGEMVVCEQATHRLQRIR